MPTGEFVDRLVNNLATPKVVDGKLWFPHGWLRSKPPLPTPLATHSLTAVRDFVKTNLDNLDTSKVIVHVQAPTEVTVLSPILTETEDSERRRICYLTAQSEASVAFGHWMDPEDFIIWLLSCFDTGGDREDVLELVSTMKAESVRENADDGYAQEVVVKSGITSVAAKKVANPIQLQPYRTFPEVWQPMSDFIIRFRSRDGQRPMIAVFASESEKWKSDAMTSIKKWLEEELTGVLVIA